MPPSRTLQPSYAVPIQMKRITSAYRTAALAHARVGRRDEAAAFLSSRRGSAKRATRATLQVSNAVEQSVYPSFLPADINEVEEAACLDMAKALRQIPIEVSCRETPVLTSCVGPWFVDGEDTEESERDPFVLLHGFDSSCLEFRRLFPLLSQHADTWALDLMGWGFTEAGPGTYTPEDKREHLYQFWASQIKKPITLVGASLGGAAAVDFAVAHPECVRRLVLVDAQGFIDGLGPMSAMPDFFKRAGINVLRSVALRQMANKMAYYDQEQYATEDAMRIGRLHTTIPGWVDANVGWMSSGGYSLIQTIPKVPQETLVLWGRQDKILDGAEYAGKFKEAITNSKLVWVDECGHVAHLEQPEQMLQHLLDFTK